MYVYMAPCALIEPKSAIYPTPCLAGTINCSEPSVMFIACLCRPSTVSPA